MRHLRTALSAVVCALTAVAPTNARELEAERPVTTAAAPLWVGNFETGNLSQWDVVDRGGGGILRAVRWPVAQGRFAARLTVTPGAHSSPAPNSDSVVLWNYARLPPNRRANGHRGSIDWYRFRLRFAPGYRATCGYFNAVGAVHHSDDRTSYAGGNGSPYFWVVKNCRTGKEVIAVRLLGGRLPRSSGRETWIKLDGSSQRGRPDTFAPSTRGPALTRGRWYDFTYRVVWSPNPRIGHFKLYLGKRLLWSGRHPTLWRRTGGGVSYTNFEMANYRRHASWNATIYVDDARIGKSWRAVH